MQPVHTDDSHNRTLTVHVRFFYFFSEKNQNVCVRTTRNIDIKNDSLKTCYTYSQTSLIRSSFIRIPRHPEENRWLPIYSICHAYIQYVCLIIRFPRLSGYFLWGTFVCGYARSDCIKGFAFQISEYFSTLPLRKKEVVFSGFHSENLIQLHFQVLPCENKMATIEGTKNWFFAS